jgi:formimidoylglutamate deiminase
VSAATGAAPRWLALDALWTGATWHERPYVGLAGDGSIAAIATSAPAGAGVETVRATAIPGVPNAHSHAFQYAMVGLAEHRSGASGNDDFWSWRDAMYRLALAVTPDEMQAIAAMVYAEMLRRGFTSVAEFHYLHHDASGAPFAQRAEMGARLVAAAEDAGIALTLVPVHYRLGGFGQPARPTQRRFLSKDVDEYAALVAATRSVAAGRADVRVGYGVHSLRAAPPEDVRAILAWREAGPLHLHVAEQRREVEEAVAHLGATPVRWLLAQPELEARRRAVALVHATHLTEDETEALARSGAATVICPTTEGNLGDGLFPLAAYYAAGGGDASPGVAIGTDSHVGLSPLEELRWLDYAQRLRVMRRDVVFGAAGDAGERLLAGALRVGALANGLAHGARLEVGAPFDAILLDGEAAVLAGKPRAHWLGALVYGGDAHVVAGVMRRGRWLVRDGRHARGPEIQRRYAAAVRSLAAR